VWLAFPAADYYGDSVAVELASRRQSRDFGAAVRCQRGAGGLFVPNGGSLPMSRPPKMRRTSSRSDAGVDAVMRRLPAGLLMDRLGLGFKQSSFHHSTQVSRRAGRSAFAPAVASPPCCCPRGLSASGKAVDLRNSSTPCRFNRRCCCACHGAPQSRTSRRSDRGTPRGAGSPRGARARSPGGRARPVRPSPLSRDGGSRCF